MVCTLLLENLNSEVLTFRFPLSEWKNEILTPRGVKTYVRQASVRLKSDPSGAEGAAKVPMRRPDVARGTRETNITFSRTRELWLFCAPLLL